MISKHYQSEVDRAIKIFLEAAHWGRETGKNLWSDADLTKENLLKYYQPEEFYVVQIDDEDASAMVIQWEDPLFWPEFKRNDAGYLHKLCIRRKFANMGLSDRMIELAKDECRQKGISKLRLDTGWSNTSLRSLYERNGFELYDRFYLGEECSFARYEIAV